MNILKFIRFYCMVFLFIIFVVFVGLVFNGGWIFTEWGFYTQFFRSMLKDLDFNIINQVDTDKAWLVTKNYFHPSIHPESQMGLMFPAYIFEYLTAKVASVKSSYHFEFALTGYLMNIFSILVGFYFNKKSAEILKLKLDTLEMIIFYFGCPLFFFSIFQTTVVEIAAFPLLSYLVYVCLNCKFGQYPKSLLAPSIAIGFLFITKVTFWPVAAFTSVVLTTHYFKNKKWAHLLQFWLVVGLLVISNSGNMWAKYGYFLNPGPPLEVFADFSIGNILTNLLYGFFPKGGLFFASPIYAFSCLGLVLFLVNAFRKKILKFYEIAFCLVWFIFVFFHQVIMMGYIVEDHLPGRIHLAAAPMLILGMVYLKGKFSSKIMNTILIVFTLWHLMITFFYLNIIQISSFVYATNMIPSAELFRQAFNLYAELVRKNLDHFVKHIQHIFIFSLIVSFVWSIARKYRYQSILLKGFAVICMLSFIGMSVLNITHNKKNVLLLKNQGFFEGKAVGSGREIYAIDYVLDYAKTIESRNDPEVNQKIKIMIDKFYDKVANQVIVSTHALDKAIQEKSPDFSFSITTEYSKVPK